MSLTQELKELIISGLSLTGVNPEDIDDDAPLFEEGLGLDSLDAVEMTMLLNKKYRVDIKDRKEAMDAYASVSSLADYVRRHRKDLAT